MPQPHKLRNEPYESDVSLLRGTMLDQVPKSSRFETAPSVDEPRVWITDKTTGREVSVPIFAAREVMKALAGLMS